MRRQTLAVLLVGAVLMGCASSSQNYRPPKHYLADNEIVVPLVRDAVWDLIIPALAQRFYVINNIDRTSGFLNVSYSGDPGRFIDCGVISGEVTDAAGNKETYQFPAAQESASYKTTFVFGQGIYAEPRVVNVSRTMELEGRINLVLTESLPKATSIRVNIRYVVTKTNRYRGTTVAYRDSHSETLSFSSGEVASFPEADTRCVATGELERDILGSIQAVLP